MLRQFDGKTPVIGSPCFLADSATIVGDVTIGGQCSIWFGAVIRGDLNSISIGDGTSVQENAVIHVTDEDPTRIGKNVTIGHGAMVHGCSIGDGTLVGIDATILDGATIGEGCIIGAGAVVTGRTRIPPRSMVLGAPGRVVRELTPAEVEGLLEHARAYWELARRYLAE